MKMISDSTRETITSGSGTTTTSRRTIWTRRKEEQQREQEEEIWRTRRMEMEKIFSEME